ncbi:MAG: phosphohydrolase [Fervidobacterium sp.]|nr:phosphohydrolase [Fervidobacterium sp.]
MNERGFIERNLNGTNYNINFDKRTFKITGNIPRQDDIYEFAMEYRLQIDEKVFDLLNYLLTANNIEELKNKVESFFKNRYQKVVKVSYKEENNELLIQNDVLKIPILSKNSGNLGHMTITGEFLINQVLGFLAFYDSFVSVIEGLILSYRLSQLLESALNTLYLALNKRARLTKQELSGMERIVTKLSEHEGIDIELGLIALKTANVGLIGVRDELFEKIRTKNITSQEWEEFLKHTDYGYEILKHLDVQIDLLDACLYHHEVLDGTGPKGLIGVQIPKLAMIIGIAENIVLLGHELHELFGKYPDEYLEIVSETIECDNK